MIPCFVESQHGGGVCLEWLFSVSSLHSKNLFSFKKYSNDVMTPLLRDFHKLFWNKLQCSSLLKKKLMFLRNMSLEERERERMLHYTLLEVWYCLEVETEASMWIQDYLVQ